MLLMGFLKHMFMTIKNNVYGFFIISLLFMASPVLALTTIDSYSETNKDGHEGIGNTIDLYSQSFAVSVAGQELDSVKFYLAKYGSPTGNIVVRLYAHTGTYGTSSVPTGSILATSDVVDITTLTTFPTFSLITFSFTGAERYALSNSTNYTAVVYFTGGDANNNAMVGVDGSSPTHGGNFANYPDGGSWTAVSGEDAPFYVYGDIIATPTPTPAPATCDIASCSYFLIADGSFDGLYMIFSIWTFLFVFFGFLFYFRTRVKSL